MKDGYRNAYDRANLDLAEKLVEIEQLKRRRGQIEALVQALTGHFSLEEDIAESQRQRFAAKAPSVAMRSEHSSISQCPEQSSNPEATEVESPADPIQARIELALGKSEAAYAVAPSERPRLFAFVS